MWGQEIIIFGMVGLSRIIPTRVGTSDGLKTVYNISEDHPHACGDKVKLWKTKILFMGSSPRVWGQERGYKWLIYLIRIIPTRVGTSSAVIAVLIFS